ncbi:MAG TPA: YdeI/OmpD-associated family protein [Gemmatimonadaceae bacterium]|nr:YdeI/OmpD-associated family protein [Gemmatimonadaceae bacterium]
MPKSKEVDAYIAKSASFAQPILTKIRTLFHQACPDIEETIKWSVPFFEYKGIVGQMAAFKQHVTLGFWKAQLLEGECRDFGMGAARLTSVADLPAERVILACIKEAVRLNETDTKLPQKARAKVAAALPVPSDFAKALKANAKANSTFAGFNQSQRNEYVEWITDAKQDATRAQRLNTAIEWLAEGKTRNWKYDRAK